MSERARGGGGIESKPGERARDAAFVDRLPGKLGPEARAKESAENQKLVEEHQGKSTPVTSATASEHAVAASKSLSKYHAATLAGDKAGAAEHLANARASAGEASKAADKSTVDANNSGSRGDHDHAAYSHEKAAEAHAALGDRATSDSHMATYRDHRAALNKSGYNKVSDEVHPRDEHGRFTSK